MKKSYPRVRTIKSLLRFTYWAYVNGSVHQLWKSFSDALQVGRRPLNDDDLDKDLRRRR